MPRPEFLRAEPEKTIEALGKFCCDAIGTLDPRALLSVTLDSHVEREPDQCPNLASSVAESSDEHAYVAPDLFTAETPLGTYQGITDQVIMSRTPGSFSTVLVPRGSTALSNDWQPGQLSSPTRSVP
jgi:hypothetical protein